MASEKTVNYTAEQTAQLVAEYTAGATVEALAEKLGRTVRSVVAKLSREGVYKAKAAEVGAKRVTKAQVLASLAAQLEVPAKDLETLEKANLEALAVVALKVFALKEKLKVATEAE